MEFLNYIAIFGGLLLTYHFLCFLHLVLLHLCKGPANLSTYNRWALITGGSDGIGFAIAKDLANNGFNICIIARNE